MSYLLVGFESCGAKYFAVTVSLGMKFHSFTVDGSDVRSVGRRVLL